MADRTNDKREIAQILFLQGKLQKKEIAQKLGVSVQTITNWSKDDNWDSLKKNLLTGKKQRLSELYDELYSTRKERRARAIRKFLKRLLSIVLIIFLAVVIFTGCLLYFAYKSGM